MLLELGSALIGLIGGGITALSKYKIEKLKADHQVAMAEQDRLTIEAEANAKIKVTEAEVAGATEIAEIGAYQTSQEVGNQNLFQSVYLERLMETDGWMKYITKPIGCVLITLFAFVDIFKGAIRPALTVYYAAASMVLTFQAWQLIEAKRQVISPTMAQNLVNSSIGTIMCLTITCVTWWFADRRMGKFLMEKTVREV